MATQNSLVKTKTNLLRQNMGYTSKTNLLRQKRSKQANSIDLLRFKCPKGTTQDGIGPKKRQNI